MIIVKIMGGLGNQMFQYALGRRMAVENNQRLKLDLNWFKTQEKRQFELNHFNIVADVASEKDLAKFFSKKKNEQFASLLKRFLSFSFRKNEIYKEKEPGKFDLEAVGSVKDRYFDGYWQSERYFKPIEQIIRDEFALKNQLPNNEEEEINEIESSLAPVSIHIRRDDFVKTEVNYYKYHVCTSDYYQKAFAYLTKRINVEMKLFVFSDDPDWCRVNLSFPCQISIISRANCNTATNDLYKMSKCKYHIIANSSYSWWGAWLSTYPEKIIIAPKNWLAPTPSILDFNSRNFYPMPDITPEKWIRVETRNNS